MFVEVVAVEAEETRQGANFTNGYRPKAFTAPPRGCNNNMSYTYIEPALYSNAIVCIIFPIEVTTTKKKPFLLGFREQCFPNYLRCNAKNTICFKKKSSIFLPNHY